MSLRRKLENSRTLEMVLSAILASYLGFCFRTTKWQSEGVDRLRQALSEGPVILVLWHSRLVAAAAHWPHDACPAATLVDTSPVARLFGAIQRRFGITPIHIRARRSGLDTTKQALKLLRAGTSLGLAADGPKGPARVMRDPPLEWARISGVPVFFYAYSTRRHRQIKSWDKTMFPLPFSSGVYVFHRWEEDVPRRLDGPDRTALKRRMMKALDATQAKADAMIGFDPLP